MVGFLQYENEDVSKGPNAVTLIELPGVQSPGILVLPIRTKEPQRWQAGYTVDIPDGKTELFFYSGKLFSPGDLIGEYDAQVAQQLTTREGLAKICQTLDEKVDEQMHRQREMAAWAGEDRLKSDLDIVLFQ